MKQKMNFNPTDKEINFVNHALEDFNNKAVGPDNHELLNIEEYDEARNRGAHSVHNEFLKNCKIR